MEHQADKPATADGATIMVVEPDILVRMVIADYLRDCGYRVIEGRSPTDVHAVIGAGEPVHVIIADVALADGACGFSLARDIRATQPGIDVILSSSPARTAERASELCDEGPLEKPYHPREALRRIESLRERRRLRAAASR